MERTRHKVSPIGEAYKGMPILLELIIFCITQSSRTSKSAVAPLQFSSC